MQHRLVCLVLVPAVVLAASSCAIATTAPASSTAAHTGKVLTVPAKVRAANRAYWKKLGITPPKGGFVLAHPWSRPWSGRSLVVPMAWLRQARKTFIAHYKSGKPLMVNAAALKADLPILRDVLEKNYSGWEVATKKGWNWNAWFRQWNATLAQDGHTDIPAKKAFAPWDTYEKFQIDSHSGPAIPSMIGHDAHAMSALLATTPDTACTSLETTDGKSHPLAADDAAQQPHAAEHWTGKAFRPASYIAYPSSYGSIRSVTCGGRIIKATPFWNPHIKSSRHPGVLRALNESIMALSGGQHGLALYHTVAPGIGYLRLAAFVSAGDEAFARLLKKLPASAGHEKLLIVDLRHNGGGNAPLDDMSRWIPVKRITQQEARVSKRSCLYPGLWFNLGQMLASRVKPPVTEGFRQSIQEGYASHLDAPASRQCPVSFKTTPGEWRYTSHHFVRHWHGKYPRLLLLVDNICGSDCEAMTWYLAQLPGTVIAGENTYGLIGFTQPGVLLLPHTHIQFDLATSYVDSYGDGRSSNGYGLDVDVILPTRGDWSKQSILALADKLTESSALPLSSGTLQ